MGVRGLTSLLQREGWLPSPSKVNNGSCGDMPSLWRDASIMSSAVAHHIVQIPAGSTLHIDGNGLAFFLHQVAYARWVEQVTGKASPSASVIRSLTSSQVVKLIPTFLPLTMLEAVTREFITCLKEKHQMELIVYWDGPRRRFKTVTDNKRRERRILEWHTLQQYCRNGALPSADVAEWEASFPKSCLFITQVRHALSLHLDMITCPEEADPEIARRAVTAGRPNHYVVGRDSDFIFMGCSYIPLDTLDASPSSKMVTACVITREELADHFSFEDEGSMIEMAILLGNDFIDRDTMPLDVRVIKADQIVRHIRDKGSGYHVTSNLEKVKQAVRFVRALYRLEDLSEYPVYETSLELDDDRLVADGARPMIPESLRLSSLQLQVNDMSAAQSLKLYLQTFVNEQLSQGGKQQPMIEQCHVDVLEKLTEKRLSATNGNVSRPDLWGDVVACYLIEWCIASAMKSVPDSKVGTISSPAMFFDAIEFFFAVQQTRKSTASSSSSPSKMIVANAAQEKEAPLSQPKPERLVLPIDEHEQAILKEIESHRVTIIHGKTGCGKSSRLPCMILKARPPDPMSKEVKFFISQPRRIAAKALVERIRSCEPELRDSIALRMGHGVREYETDKTRAWFVTTGYLVRKLANQPDEFDNHTHLIIDEVHERSVDTDILCFLCQRLLKSNRRIRLILMSATLAAELYQAYFKVERPVIEVSARRFPIQEIYVEDLPDMFNLDSTNLKAVQGIVAECNRVKCKSHPNSMNALIRMSVLLTKRVGKPGSSVLIFVPGMSEIIDITDQADKLCVSGVQFTCIPIHSDIPFEDQMTAFDTPRPDEVKVIVATNAAESSVTLPDVDHVICLGLCKRIEYNESTHRQMLVSCWISRASATQRAGRTGRVRPGFVYRMYTRETFESHMGEFEPGEMARIPLDSVILSLKGVLREEATPVLCACLEPPDISTIDRSFKSLHDSDFITEPDDWGEVTTLGSFVSALGIDLTLGSLVGCGIQMGVGPEVLEMAAALSFPLQPWVMTNPFYYAAANYNDNTSKSYLSRCHFDANSYSEPFAIMNLMWDFEETSNKANWCRFYNISMSRIQSLVSTRNSLRTRVAQFFHISDTSLQLEAPPRLMPHAKLTILRVLQVWQFWETIIEYKPIDEEVEADDAFNLRLQGNGLQDAHLDQVFDRKRHAFRLKKDNKVIQKGSFTPVSERFEASIFVPQFEQRFLSFATEKSYDLVWLRTDDQFLLYIRAGLSKSTRMQPFIERELQSIFASTTLTVVPNISGQRGGIKERACGQFKFHDAEQHDAVMNLGDPQAIPSWTKFSAQLIYGRRVIPALEKLIKGDIAFERSMSCEITQRTKNKLLASPKIEFVSRGNCTPLNKQDMVDLLATSDFEIQTTELGSDSQVLSFDLRRNTPLLYNRKFEKLETGGSIASALGDASSNESWSRPLLANAPEGARLSIVLMSGRMKEHIIEFAPLNSEKESAREPETAPVIVELLPFDLKISSRWKLMDTDKRALVKNVNSVPASVVPLLEDQRKKHLFCCCASSLEIPGGGIGVEGLTLLPPGRMFLLLSLLTFDLFPLHSTIAMTKDSLVSLALEWEKAYTDETLLTEEIQKEKSRRLEMAYDFQNACSDLGEKLVCIPNNVRSLCEIFDGVDGYESRPWDSLNNNPFVEKNLELLQHDKKMSSSKYVPTPEKQSVNGSKRQGESGPFKTTVSFSVSKRPVDALSKRSAATSRESPKGNGSIGPKPELSKRKQLEERKSKTGLVVTATMQNGGDTALSAVDEGLEIVIQNLSGHLLADEVTKTATPPSISEPSNVAITSQSKPEVTTTTKALQVPSKNPDVISTAQQCREGGTKLMATMNSLSNETKRSPALVVDVQTVGDKGKLQLLAAQEPTTKKEIYVAHDNRQLNPDTLRSATKNQGDSLDNNGQEMFSQLAFVELSTTKPNEDTCPKQTTAELRKSSQQESRKPVATDVLTALPVISSPPSVDRIAPTMKFAMPPASSIDSQKQVSAKKAQLSPALVSNVVALTEKVTFLPQEINLSDSLFKSSCKSGEVVSDPEKLETTNVLALLVHTYCDRLLLSDKNLTPEETVQLRQRRYISLSPLDWSVFTTSIEGTIWFFARFNSVIPWLPLEGRRDKSNSNKTKEIPKFMQRNCFRPRSKKDALTCFPPQVAAHFSPKPAQARFKGDKKATDVILFETLEKSLHAEAAFWLDRQFYNNGQHWYEQQLEAMVQKLVAFATEPQQEASVDQAKKAQTECRQLAAATPVYTTLPIVAPSMTVAEPAESSSQKKQIGSSSPRELEKEQKAQPPKTHISNVTLALTAKPDFSTEEMKLSQSLFERTRTSDQGELRTTNLLAMLVHSYCDVLLRGNLTDKTRMQLKKKRYVTLTPSDWSIFTTTPKEGEEEVWFYAEFRSVVPPLPHGPKKQNSDWPSFMKRNDPRPKSMVEAVACFPPEMASDWNLKVDKARIGNQKGISNVVLFETLEKALLAEAAFWLERQFMTIDKHWYEQRVEDMNDKLVPFATKQKEKTTKQGKADSSKHGSKPTNGGST